MAQFISYHISDYVDAKGNQRSVPIACGETREECQRLAIQRVLMIGCTEGGLSTCKRDDVDAETFAELKTLLDSKMIEMGADQAA